RRERHEREPRMLRDQVGERRLAGSRRAPQDQRAGGAALDRGAQRAALADDLLLAQELGERAPPPALREPGGLPLRPRVLVAVEADGCAPRRAPSSCIVTVRCGWLGDAARIATMPAHSAIGDPGSATCTRQRSAGAPLSRSSSGASHVGTAAAPT